MSRIEITDLTISYPTEKASYQALSHVSLTVPSGTVCAVIGPSGCGKSTLLKAIAGLIPVQEGKISIDSSHVNPREQSIGFMPQNYGLLPWRTVRENILLGCKIRHKKPDAEKVEELCGKLGIGHLMDRYPGELSGGQQQRVSLARVFLLQPDILLMDEPFSALDAITREEMQEVFRTLWEQSKVTTILVTHYVEEALYLGSRIVLMSPHPGTVSELIDNPLAGRSDLRETQEFLDMGRRIRTKIKEMRRKAMQKEAEV